MPATIKIHSIYRSLFMYIVSFILLIIITGIGIISNLAIEDSKINLEQNAANWSNVIAKQSIEFIEKDLDQVLELSLKAFSQSNLINYIHIYKIQASPPSIEYFTSYKKGGQYPSIPDKIDEIEHLQQAKHSDKYIEIITPIEKNNHILGYVYLQISNQRLEQITNQILFATIMIIICCVLLSMMFIVRLLRKITEPLKSITRTVQHIYQSKEYNTRCGPEPYKEVDILAKNLNILLTRTEVKFNKLKVMDQEKLVINQTLKDKVNLRSDALKESNQELLTTLEKLHQFQGQLVESEKMASLGDMVAGVAHEVNTPIGLGVTASTLLLDRINELKDAFENKTLKSSQLKKFLSEGQENVSIIYRNLNRAADLISSFKKVAVDQSSEENRKFDVKQLINDILLTLAPQLKKQPITIDIHCPENLVVTSKPGPINQILINLILNSLLHAFEGISDGIITISIMDLSGQLNITYSDNGNGVDPSIKNKIFDPFITTKRGSGGSGLGLHLVYNLVTQALGGHIHLESEVNQGVIFEINFPVKIEKN
ncbi:MAG: ATP-binding protein [Colwellia sp.]|nr:ATP-binding protein [Colwellia sp.]